MVFALPGKVEGRKGVLYIAFVITGEFLISSKLCQKIYNLIVSNSGICFVAKFGVIYNLYFNVLPFLNTPKGKNVHRVDDLGAQRGTAATFYLRVICFLSTLKGDS